MYLDDEDRRVLEGFAHREREARRMVPLVVVGGLAVAGALVATVESDLRFIPAAGVVLVVAVVVFVLRKASDRGAGSASAILKGRDPRRTVYATVVGELGDDPYRWTLEVEAPPPGARFVHFAPGEFDDWELRAGDRYRVAFFDDVDAHRGYGGVVLVTPEISSTRHWLYSVRLSDSDSYVHVVE